MANDREVLRLIWDGKIPIQFVPVASEIVGMQHPEPMFLMVSRLTYLPLVTEKVTKHFNRYQDEIWFECNSKPLKWNLPVGVLYDLFGKDSQKAEEEVSQEENLSHKPKTALPWTITVRFGNPPDDLVLRCPSKEIVESQFMSALKEADFLKHRGQIISTMQKKDHSQLWLGLLNDKFDQFWAVNRRLMEPAGDQETFKSIPVRCYYEDGVYVQKLFGPVTETGSKMTLGDLLEQFSTDNYKVSGLVHGIKIEPETPLQWLSEHLSYPDNFLHICLIPRQEQDSAAAAAVEECATEC